MLTTWPRLLHDFAPLPGTIKTRYADFVVEEVPLYAPAGSGTHTYFLLEKEGLSTFNAVADLARALGVDRRSIGLAGMKDARAVTRQWLSVEHVPPERIAGLDLPRIRIRDVALHSNKLRIGHLWGNRFVIRVRNSRFDALPALRDALQQLRQRGVPNYFGPQRFGQRGDSWAVGRALLRNDLDEAFDVLLGNPDADEPQNLRAARAHYVAGAYEEAARHWPPMFRDERRALHALARSGGNRRRALSAIDRATRRFYISAFQSYLFNQVVARRMTEGVDVLWPGDLAWIHEKGAVFFVDDPQAEQPRATAGEISPSGPLFGHRMSRPGAVAGKIEDDFLAAEGLTAAAFGEGPHRVKGARRPLRFLPGAMEIELGADDLGNYFELRFALPRGCYATTLLRELFSIGVTSIEEDDAG